MFLMFLCFLSIIGAFVLFNCEDFGTQEPSKPKPIKPKKKTPFVAEWQPHVASKKRRVHSAKNKKPYMTVYSEILADAV